MRSALSKTGLVVAATLAALLVAEGLARIIGVRAEYGQIVPLGGKPTRQVDGIDLWDVGSPRFDASDVHAAAADRDGFTILGLGDSIMYGVQQEKEVTYLEQARRLVAERAAKQVHVLNMATPGYNTLQENATYKEIAPQVHPNLVLVHYWQNDARQYRVVGGYVVDFADISPDGRLVVRALPLPDALSDWLLVHSRVYGLLTHYVLDYKRRNQPNDWTSVEKPLSEIHERARSAGARLVILASPQMTGAAPEPSADLAMLKDFATRQGIELIDLTEWVQGRRSQDLSFDGSHFTAEGHRLLGERLADYLLARDLKP